MLQDPGEQLVRHDGTLGGSPHRPWPKRVSGSNYLCGLACATSTSRMMYAFARDGGLPGSSALKQVSPRWKTPVTAIWAAAALAVASTLYAPAYSTLSTACVIFLYLSYVMPTVCGFFVIGKTWTKMGPFDLGPRLYKLLAAVSVVGVLLVVWIGVQPPNDNSLVRRERGDLHRPSACFSRSIFSGRSPSGAGRQYIGRSSYLA
ncbi:MAG: amino acid permease [Deltaproteobacteria bacterium]